MEPRKTQSHFLQVWIISSTNTVFTGSGDLDVFLLFTMNLGACAWNPGALPHDVLHVSLILFGPVSQPRWVVSVVDRKPSFVSFFLNLLSSFLFYYFSFIPLGLFPPSLGTECFSFRPPWYCRSLDAMKFHWLMGLGGGGWALWFWGEGMEKRHSYHD